MTRPTPPQSRSGGSDEARRAEQPGWRSDAIQSPPPASADAPFPTAGGDLPGARYDILVDVSRSGLGPGDVAAHLDHLTEALRSFGSAGVATVAVASGMPAGVSRFACLTPEAAVVAALAAAARRGRPLVVVNGAWTPRPEHIEALLALTDIDPLIGVVQPRFGAPDGKRIIALPSVTTSVQTLASSQARFLGEFVITPELPAALLVLTARAVRAMEPPAQLPADATLPVVLSALRRRGFRTLVANQVVVPFPLASDQAYGLPAADDPAASEIGRARDAVAALPERALERVLSASITADGRARLLLDCRGLRTRHDGTSQVIGGLLEGFSRLHLPEFELNALASATAAEFHGLKRRFPDLDISTGPPSGSFMAAILPHQPWYTHTIFDLHSRALFIIFNVLDTISWDILDPGPPDLDETWRVMAREADGLLFISDFARQRFAFRFAPDPATPLEVAHLSVALEDIVRHPLGKAPFAEPYLLLFGNDYDHKSLRPTIATLAGAFPSTRIVALGLTASDSPNISAIPSGALPEGEVDALIGHAAAVVYPSHSEGFGLPVVHGLARGRTVIVRQSPLWEEIAGIARLPGRMVAFWDDASLVQAVGQALDGVPATGLAMGGRLAAGQSPPTWSDAASRIIDLVRHLSATGDGRRWVARQISLQRPAPR